MIRRAFFGLLLLFIPFAGYAQYLCSVNNDLLVPGERLDYQLYYNVGFVWIPAGTCEFRVRNALYNKKPAYQLSAQGKSHKSFDVFYRVRDTLISYVDTQTLTPFRAIKYTHEDNWNGIDDFTFRKVNGDWNITTRLKRKHGWKPPEESVSTRCGFDIVTSIYRLRCFASADMYVKGKRLDIPVRLDDGEYMVHLTYLGKERVKLFGDGYYNAHTFTLSMIEGNIFKRGDLLKMWISDDKNRIPLLIESPIRVGFVKALFRGGENTKYPIVQASAKE
ncbi:MAG TPA: DUF3108 domain-containing protein [Bacteroidales bacterium]|nr:DUF3108 domain-containing protein [Bacteroidales bacterium]